MYPKLLFEDEGNEFRQRFQSLSTAFNMQWLAPLLVMIDGLESNQYELEEELRELLKLIEETINHLSVAD